MMMRTRLVEMWQLKVLILQIIVMFFSSSIPATKADGGPMNLLMVGNSFSDSHNMEEMIQSMLEERKMMLQTDSIFAARFEVGGANMTHYAFSNDLTTMLNERPWTWVILQEQSQIPGFCADEPAQYLASFNDSLKSIISLDEKIEKNGATTILFETWGYFDQDPYNPEYFPDYQTMQDKLSQGYQLYHDNVLKKNPKSNIKIAPAGLAFQRVYKTIEDRGEDPHAEGSLFEQLYMKVEDHPTPDHNMARKYPTLEGAYLCGCVLFQTITGLDVRKSTFTPLGMKPDMRIMMQKVAYDTVVEFQGGTPPKSNYDLSATKPPYKPEYQAEKRMADTRTSSIWNWFLAIILMGGGLASYWIAAKKRNATAAAFGQPRDYGWNPISADDTSGAMELADVSLQRSNGPNL